MATTATELNEELKGEGFPMLMRATETCKALNCARSTLTKLVRDKVLKPTRLARDLRFRRSDVARYLASGEESDESDSDE